MLVLAALATFGCGPRARCAEGACPEGTLCELDGTCRPLADDESSRFARALRLEAADWASSERGGRGHDQLPLGRGAEVFLAFEVPPGELLRAVLTLHVTSASGVGDVQVFASTAFVGDEVDRGWVPRRLGRVEVAREALAGPGRPVRVDVARLIARAGLGREGGRVYLGLRRAGDAARWRVASPVAVDPELWPSLDLRVR
ncbi:MAG: hypothetical protein KF901_07920 [Myxococcales bacterium]|nr:hypothetical protein [Myxococcales bacterium]